MPTPGRKSRRTAHTKPAGRRTGSSAAACKLRLTGAVVCNTHTRTHAGARAGRTHHERRRAQGRAAGGSMPGRAPAGGSGDLGRRLGGGSAGGGGGGRPLSGAQMSRRRFDRALRVGASGLARGRRGGAGSRLPPPPTGCTPHAGRLARRNGFCRVPGSAAALGNARSTEQAAGHPTRGKALLRSAL